MYNGRVAVDALDGGSCTSSPDNILVLRKGNNFREGVAKVAVFVREFEGLGREEEVTARWGYRHVREDAGQKV